MAEETQYTANTGMVVISTANSNLDGTGTLGTVLTGASNGTLIKSVIIKAQTNTSNGTVRLFVTGGGSTQLLMEVEVPAVTKSSIDPSFEAHIPIDFTLQSGYVLKASTENADTFNVIAEGLDWAYYATSVRTDTTQYTAVTGIATISVKNTELSGSGTIVRVLVASGANGCALESFTVKREGTTSPGMVRLFIQDSGATQTILFKEIPVNAVTQTGITQSFDYNYVLEDDFELQRNYKIYAAPENNETFSVIGEGLDKAYLA